MPWWVPLQIAFGLGMGVMAMLPGIRDRSVRYVTGDLACTVCGATMLIAYHNIRINAAIGGWVIALFSYSLAWEIGFVTSKVTSLEGPGQARWNLAWLKEGAGKLQVARFAFFLLPALYLGGVLTARIWYPPPLRDPLTYGLASAGALKTKLDKMIPAGAPARLLRDSVERHGFHCLDRPEEVRLGGTFTHLSCNASDYAVDSSLQTWQITGVFRHDSLVELRISLEPRHR